MTVSSEDFRISHNGGGTTGPFGYNFLVYELQHMEVVKLNLLGDEVILEPGVDFTASGLGNEDGGTITLDEVLAVGEKITITVNPPPLQELDLNDDDDFPAEAIELQLDLMVMMIRRDRTLVERALVLRSTDVDGSGAFNARGNRITNVGEAVEDDDVLTLGFASDLRDEMEDFRDEAEDAAQTAVSAANTSVLASGNATIAKNLSEKWASEAEDVVVSSGKYSAYHWATKAFNAVSTALTSIASALSGALTDINTDKTSALSAISTANSNALSGITTSKNSALADIATDKSGAQSAIATDRANALSAIGAAETSALGDIATDRASALAAISSAQTTATGAVTSAQTTATNAITSAKNTALTDIDNAAAPVLAAEAKAAAWAEEDEDVEVEAGQFSAKHWAIKAQDAASGEVTAATTSFSPSGGVASTNVQNAIMETYNESARSTHSHAISDVTNLQTTLDGKIDTTARGAANGVASLGSDGLIPTGQLPALAITDTYEVANQSAMLALSAQKGDIAIRTDENKTYVLTSNSPGTLADWKLLRTPTDLVLSVAGLTGAVSASSLKAALAMAISDVSGLQTALDGKSGTGHTHAYNDLTSKPTLGTAAAMNEGTTAEFLAKTADKILSTDQVWAAGAYVALVDGASIALNLAAGLNFSVTLGGNRALANASNLTQGQCGVIAVKQDATGSRTLSFGTDYEFDSGTALVLSTAANAEDLLFYHVRGAGRIVLSHLKAVA